MLDAKNEKQAMSLQVTEGLSVTIYPNSNHEFLMSTNEVAIGYGINDNALSNIKKRNPDEFIDGKHFATALTICDSGARISSSDPHNKVYWTKRGIVRLGFFIKSERARLFRDWAEDLIVKKAETRTVPAKHYQTTEAIRDFKPLIDIVDSAAIVCGNHSQLAKRLGMHPSFFCHITKRPWLLSDERLQAIETGCRNIIANKNTVDTEAIEALVMVKDAKTRLTLFTKMRKGGLL